MAPKSKTFWKPPAQAHLSAASMLRSQSINQMKSAAVTQRKMASFRAAAKLAAAKPIKPLKTSNSMTPQAPSPTPAVKPVVSPMSKVPTPPKLPTSPS